MSLPTSPNEDTDPFSSYKQVLETGEVGYAAGFPHYPRNFSRDTITAGIISSSAVLLASQIAISAHHQGENYDPQTGEMPGKIHHEFPGVKLNGGDKYTTYNACDTTALFLIATEGLLNFDEPAFSDFTQQKVEKLKRAVDYIFAHIGNDDLFWEKPPGGSDNYALKVTYWKDSILAQSDGKIEPVYPVVFPLAHFIAARGLLSASRVLGDPGLGSTADKMFRTGIKEFMRPDSYTAYRDSVSELRQISSDELHSLAYIPRVYADLLPVEAMQQRAESLITPFGYMCTPTEVSQQLSDRYHGDTVWVFEQALINYGATKFSLNQEAKIAASVSAHIGEGQELFSLPNSENGEILPIPAGNDRQLWSIASREYFAGRSSLSVTPWL